MTGIVRRIDDLGRIVIPREMRRILKINGGDSLEILVGGEGEIVIKKYPAETNIKEILNELDTSICEQMQEIGEQRAEEIRRHIKEIKMLLNEKE